MSNWNTLPHIKLGVYPTPFYRLENISRIYNKDIWIKRDDLCGVAPDTCQACIDAGANVLVAGSAVYKAEDIPARIKLLRGE